MPTSVITVPAFTIAELTGDRRTLQLIGRALPYRPFSLKVKQKIETTWLPGSAWGVGTILGPQDDPTTINGTWKDKFIAQSTEAIDTSIAGPPRARTTFPATLNGEPVENVRALVVICDSLCRSGQLLRVSWDEQVREGHLETWEAKWLNTHDVEWQMDFVWLSRGDQHGATVVTTEGAVSEGAETLSQAYDTFEEKTAAPKFAVAQGFFADRDARLASIKASAKAPKASVGAMAQRVIGEFDAARRSIAACTSLIADTAAFVLWLETEAPHRLNADAVIDAQPFGQRLLTATYVRGMIDGARALKRHATLKRANWLRRVESELLAQHTARKGEDLRTISSRYYGTPFEWRRLAIFNQLRSGQELQPGQLVLVPKLTLYLGQGWA